MENKSMRPNFPDELCKLIRMRINIYPELSIEYCSLEDVKRYDALPIGCDLWALIFLRTNGTMFSLDVIDNEISPITELWQQLVCLRLASNNFPDLINVLPAKPEKVIVCDICEGAGFVEKPFFKGKGSNFPCWVCGTMGWYDGQPLYLIK